MATFKINGKNFATQDGTGEPTVSTNVNIDASLAAANFPAGHVIQIQYYRFTDSDSDSGGQWQDSPASITITPHHSSSFILVQLFGGFGLDNNANDTNTSYRLYNNTQSTVLFEHQGNVQQANGYAYGLFGSTFGGLDISPNSGANLYKFQYGKNGGSGPSSFNPYGKQCVMIAMEIKQ